MPEETAARPESPLAIKNCALISVATGRRAQNLRELGMQLAVIPVNSIYYHFWGGLLRPSFDDPEYQNDFAAWARHSLHDYRLAERLAIVDPTEYHDLENLRRDLIEIVEERIEETEMVPWAKRDQQFPFIESQIVIFDTGIKVHDPAFLIDLLPSLSAGSIFYHFIDARRRNPEWIDDFRRWLQGFGDRYAKLIQRIGALDPHFGSLTELREDLSQIFKTYFEWERV
jgi:hypothetical protein